jgi:hypothetical protein
VTGGNFSLTDLLLWTTGRDLSSVLPAVATAMVLLVPLLLPGRRTCRDRGNDPAGEEGRTALLLSLGCASFLLASPRAWGHYYLLSLPLLLALWGMGTGGAERILARRLLALLSALMISVVSPAEAVLPLVAESRGVAGRLLAEADGDGLIVAMGFVMWGGALLAWVTGAWEMARGPSGSDPRGNGRGGG